MSVSAKCDEPEISLNRINSRRRDANFSEIYELIFYNDTMVRSELEVLHLLVKNKLKYHNEPMLPENGMDSGNSFLPNLSGESV